MGVSAAQGTGQPAFPKSLGKPLPLPITRRSMLN